MTEPPPYFAYGSNLPRARIEERLGRCEVIGAARLARHALRFHKRGRDGSGKGDAYPTGEPDDVVFGVLYRLDAGQVAVLDRFEGGGYERRAVTVRLDGAESAAFTYVALPHALAPDLVPFDWYKALVLAGACEHRLPESYVAAIRAVPSRPDPDASRAAAAERLLAPS